MFCHKCGHQLAADTHKYCANCGSEVATAVIPSAGNVDVPSPGDVTFSDDPLHARADDRDARGEETAQSPKSESLAPRRAEKPAPVLTAADGAPQPELTPDGRFRVLTLATVLAAISVVTAGAVIAVNVIGQQHAEQVTAQQIPVRPPHTSPAPAAAPEPAPSPTPPNDSSSSPSPNPSAPRATKTTVTINVAGCEGCTIGVQRAIEVGNPSGIRPGKPDYWNGDTADVLNGVATLEVPTRYTPGMSFTLTAPWEGDTGAVANIVLGSSAPTGTTVTTTQALATPRATACWAGTTQPNAEIDVRVAQINVEGYGGPTLGAAAWASPTVDTVGPLTDTNGGTLNNQEAFYC